MDRGLIRRNHFIRLKLSSPSQLCLLPEASLKISLDASAYGLGAVLLQSSADDTWKPVAYASRFMSDTEQRYSQIEKEALEMFGLVRSSRIMFWVSTLVLRLTTNHWYHFSVKQTLPIYLHEYFVSG